MDVKFILGRSGSGKTRYCLEMVRAELRRAALGYPLLLLVPEQATFQMEQALLGDEQLSGYHRVRVVSFARLVRLVLLQSEPVFLPILSPLAKQMILRRLLQEHRQELGIFSRSADRAGFIAQLGGMISELRQYQKTPEQLTQQRQKLLEQNNPRLAPLVEKLADLALIYQAYQHYISDRFIDPDDLLDLLSHRGGRAEILHHAHLWVDGFSGFTPQQYTALLAMVERVDEAHISLCLDPQHEQFRRANDATAPETALDDTYLFYPTLGTYRRLRRLFADSCRLEPEKIILFDYTTPPPPAESPIAPGRFGGSPALARLEGNLFRVRNVEKTMPKQSPDMSPRQGSSTAAGPEALTVSWGDIPVKDIVVVESAERRREVEAAAVHILRLCREHDYRFRDIAVILRDFTGYQELLEETFTDHGIAYFLDQRRSVRHHPLMELLRSAVQVIASDFKTEHLLSYLKTDMPPLPRLVIDTLENYVLLHGIESSRWYDEKPWSFRSRLAGDLPNNNLEGPYQLTGEQLNQYRRQVLAPLLHMREILYPRRFQPDRLMTIHKISEALVKLLEELNITATLSGWYRRARQDKNLDLAQTHKQIYANVTALLDDLTEAMGDVLVTISQYGEILTAALGQMTLALVPPALDQVLIGAIERSRHPKIKAAFVLGVNEGRFPKVQTPDAFFTDAQRQQLSRDGFELAPTSVERLLQERYLAYIALTRPSDFLWVSYSLADERGSVLNPSPLIEDIHAAAGNVPTIRLSETFDLDRSAMVNPVQLGHQLAMAFSEIESSSLVGDVYQQLYHYALTHSDWASTIQRCLAGVIYHNTAQLDQETVEQSFRRQSCGSVSRLESFAACPFQHFGRYLLNLKQREELKLAAVDVGSFYHKALCKIFEKMRQKQRNWHDLTDDELELIVDQAAHNLIHHEHQVIELLEQSYRNKYLLQEAVSRLQRFCRMLRGAARVGDFRQQQAELEFGDGKALPALELKLPGNRRFLIHGQIDRVDVCQKTEHPEKIAAIMVIDYKSTGRTFTCRGFIFTHSSSRPISPGFCAAANHRPRRLCGYCRYRNDL